MDRQRANTESPETIIGQCDTVECLLRDSCTGYVNAVDYSNLQGVWNEWKEENINYEVLLPNHQDDAGEAGNYDMFITEHFFYTNEGNRERFKVDHSLLYCNKRIDLSINCITWLIDNCIIRMYYDFDDEVLTLVDEILTSRDENEGLKEKINLVWPLRPIEKSEDDVQDEMITWAIAQNNRR